MTEKTTFGFRVRFHLSEGDSIEHKAEQLEIVLPNSARKLLVRSLDGEMIASASTLSIRCRELSSERDAILVGKQTKDALLLAGSILRMGIDVGRDTASSGIGKIVRDKALQEGVRLLNDVHGISVFPEDLPVRFLRVSGKAVVGRPAEGFIGAFIAGYDLAPGLDSKTRLALELYASSHFESSLRARFLTLISSVESLALQGEVSEAVTRHIDELLAATKRYDLGPYKDSLMSRLGQLKIESISDSCRNLLSARLGGDVAGQFIEYYRIRGDMLHDGSVPEGTDLGSVVPALDDLVSELLLAVTRGKKGS